MTITTLSLLTDTVKMCIFWKQCSVIYKLSLNCIQIRLHWMRLSLKDNIKLKNAEGEKTFFAFLATCFVRATVLKTTLPTVHCKSNRSIFVPVNISVHNTIHNTIYIIFLAIKILYKAVSNHI